MICDKIKILELVANGGEDETIIAINLLYAIKWYNGLNFIKLVSPMLIPHKVLAYTCRLLYDDAPMECANFLNQGTISRITSTDFVELELYKYAINHQLYLAPSFIECLLPPKSYSEIKSVYNSLLHHPVRGGRQLFLASEVEPFMAEIIKNENWKLYILLSDAYNAITDEQLLSFCSYIKDNWHALGLCVWDINYMLQISNNFSYENLPFLPTNYTTITYKSTLNVYYLSMSNLTVYNSCTSEGLSLWFIHTQKMKNIFNQVISNDTITINGYTIQNGLFLKQYII